MIRQWLDRTRDGADCSHPKDVDRVQNENQMSVDVNHEVWVEGHSLSSQCTPCTMLRPTAGRCSCACARHLDLGYLRDHSLVLFFFFGACCPMWLVSS